MDGASEDPVWMTRRVVLAVLLVVGVLTTGYAFVAVGSDDDQESVVATDTATDEVVTSVRPSGGFDGPLRLGRMLVVGRHGDPVSKPENTAESFADALDAGVDHVEAEVVMSKDDQLVVLGSNELGLVSDVADRPEFADRETTKTIDGRETTGWFTEDFTLDELRTLRAVEPDPEQRPESASQDGELALIGFDDLVTQVEDKSDELGREIGIFVQPLRPSYFRNLDLPIEPALVKSLRRAQLNLDPERVTVESADLDVLQRVEDSIGDNVLTAYIINTARDEELDEDRLADLPDTLDAVAIEVGAFAGKCPFVIADRIHGADLAMMIYPISSENALLTPSFRSDSPQDPAPSERGDLRGQVVGLAQIDIDVILAESPGDVVEVVRDLEADPPPAVEKSC